MLKSNCQITQATKHRVVILNIMHSNFHGLKLKSQEDVIYKVVS
jgi:hypothetical protein